MLTLSPLVLLSVMFAAATGRTALTPVLTVQAFHDALSSGDREKVLALLDPRVVTFEQGWAETSREEYASHHLADDLDFSRSTKWKILDQHSGRGRSRLGSHPFRDIGHVS